MSYAMREQFEKWVKQQLGLIENPKRYDDGYLNDDINFAWEALQASCAVPIALPKRCCFICDEMYDKTKAALIAQGYKVAE